MSDSETPDSADGEDTASGADIAAMSQAITSGSTAAEALARLRNLARWSLVVGGAMCCLAVLAGAFGAHALRSHVSADLLAVFETGARYQMYHGLAMMALGLAAVNHLLGMKGARWAFGLFLTGTVVFSGSLYLLTLTGMRSWGAVTPVGGVFQIVGWIIMIAGLWRNGIPRQSA
jgi:uncharacterized membrane protein YgdD (TMEM256/DUF423 family)